MRQKLVSRIALVVDEKNEKALAAAEDFRRQLRHYGVSEIVPPFDAKKAIPDLIMVLGGDRMILRAIQEMWKLRIPFSGLSYGKIGALANEPEEFSFAALTKGEYYIHFFPLLIFRATDLEAKIIEGVAANDIAVRAETRIPGSCHLRISTRNISASIKEETLFEELIGDGFLLATPLGSTAYNYNAGGPVIDPSLEIMAATAIVAGVPYPYSVHHPEVKFRIEVLRPETQTVNLTYDSEAYCGIRSIEVGMTQGNIRLAFFRPFTFASHLKRLAKKQRR